MSTITVSVPLSLRSEYRIGAIVAAFGVFDGVHVGHRRVLSRVVQLAQKLRATPTAITFDTHPRAVVSADLPPPLLSSIPQRLRLLGGAGMEATVLLPFGPAMAAMGPEEFLETYVFAPDGPRVLAVCIGSSWRFGKGGVGNVATLAREAQRFGCRVESVPEVLLDGRPISSTRIRDEVQAGRLEAAAALLGRPFSVAGTVSPGKGIGQSQLGCPTANIHDEDIVLPPSGVYAARARRIDRGTQACGIVYVGSAPTFVPAGTPPPARVVELHLFGMAESLYGEEVEVEFTSFLRGDCCFASVEELKLQIRRDIAVARRRLGLAPAASPA